MTRTASADFKTHLAGAVTTLATCWHVTRTDGAEFFFTNHDADITYDGDVYVAASGFSPTAVQANIDLSVDNLEVVGVLDSAEITDPDVRTGKFNYATVEVFVLNLSDLTDGKVWQAYGTLGAVSVRGTQFVAELRSLTQRLQANIGRRLMKTCDADLGDARCGVNLASFTVTGTVSSVTSRLVFAVSSAPAAAGGLLTFTSGDNSGFVCEVYGLAGSTITLLKPAPYDIAVGNAYSVFRGCDHLLPTCRDVFNNVINFRGYPSMVGMDEILDYPDAQP